MKHAGQAVPKEPTLPDEETRIARAKLIMEEALETVAALGFSVTADYVDKESSHIKFFNQNNPNLTEIVDGCLDLRVVATGTLSACGVADLIPQSMVDENNLQKFGPGGHRDANGKWIKPPGHKPPDLSGEIERQKNYSDV